MENNKKPVDKDKELKLISDVSEIKRNVAIVTEVLVGSKDILNGKVIETPGLVDTVEAHAEKIQALESYKEKSEKEKDAKKWKQAGILAGAATAGTGAGLSFKGFLAWLTSLF